MQADERHIPHIDFDLNNSRNVDIWWRSDKCYDLIVYAETIEHLTIAPEYSILMLSNMLAPKGVLLLTTPNASTVSKRIKLLYGKNPFEQIRLLSENPGHFREYTLDELCEIGKRCNLTIRYKKLLNFYNHKSLAKIILKNVAPSFRDSLIVVYSKSYEDEL